MTRRLLLSLSALVIASRSLKHVEAQSAGEQEVARILESYEIVARGIRDEIKKVKGISSVSVSGTRKREVQVIIKKEALEKLMSKTDEEREAMGKNGRRLVEEKFSIESVANRFILLYQWILTGDNKPEFVYE